MWAVSSLGERSVRNAEVAGSNPAPSTIPSSLPVPGASLAGGSVFFYDGIEAASMTFIVDGMLGKLAKWLKILGFDALFMADDDDQILAAARRENRTLLTRDREFVRRAGRHPALLIESTFWPDQVRQVLARFDLYGEARPFTRCLECNVPSKLCRGRRRPKWSSARSR